MLAADRRTTSGMPWVGWPKLAEGRDPGAGSVAGNRVGRRSTSRALNPRLVGSRAVIGSGGKQGTGKSGPLCVEPELPALDVERVTLWLGGTPDEACKQSRDPPDARGEGV